MFKSNNKNIRTLPVPCIAESCIKIKVNLNFYFHTSKAFNAFIKPFETPQGSVKIKI